MKVSELITELQKANADADVYMEYIPYNAPPKIHATYYPEMNALVLDYEESDE